MGDSLDAPALFSTIVDPAPADAGDTDLLRALVFRCGEYPDQQFALTEAEADALIADFAPVEARHGHPRSDGPLDGKMGTMIRLWREGRELFGLFAVPKWLTALIPPADRKLSLGITRAPIKRIAEWSWVTHPVISDAQLHAAFAQASTRRPDPASAVLSVAGAGSPGVSTAGLARYPKENRMSRFDEFMAWLKGETETAPAPLTEAPPPALPAPPAEPAAFAADRQALETERRTLDAERAEFAQTRYRQQAELAVDKLIADGHVLPAEDQPNASGQRALVAIFAQALADDATGTALFGQQDGSRYAALTAAYAARAPHTLTREAIPVVTLPDAGAPPVDLAARRAELLAASPLGQAALKLQQKES
jgi:hypothetical protein